MGINLRWDITNKCRMKCIHCYNAEFRRSRYDVLDEDSIDTIINKLPRDKIKVVKLMGGEPFNSDYIGCICDKLDKRGLMFGVTTNGDFDFEFCDAVAFSKERFSYITFSMDGYKEEAKLFRKNLNVDNVILNIKTIKRKYPNIVVCVNLIINKINYSSIYDILDYYACLGVKKINITNLSGDKTIVNRYRCNNEQLISAIKAISRFINNHDNIIIECSFCCNKMTEQLDTSISQRMSFDYRCLAGREIGYIDYMGNLLPCEAILRQEKLYNFYISKGEYSLLQHDFNSIWMKEAFLEVYKHDVYFRLKNEANNPSCIQCSSKKICGDCFYATILD